MVLIFKIVLNLKTSLFKKPHVPSMFIHVNIGMLSTYIASVSLNSYNII